jgi:hypothetical protein
MKASGKSLPKLCQVGDTMDFEKAASLIGTVTDLRRIASAHVIDHNQLKDDDLTRTKPPYTTNCSRLPAGVQSPGHS